MQQNVKDMLDPNEKITYFININDVNDDKSNVLFVCFRDYD